jgi:chromosome segregation ATPase
MSTPEQTLDDLRGEIVRLQTHLNALISERNALISERNALISERDAHIACARGETARAQARYAAFQKASKNRADDQARNISELTALNRMYRERVEPMLNTQIRDAQSLFIGVSAERDALVSERDSLASTVAQLRESLATFADERNSFANAVAQLNESLATLANEHSALVSEHSALVSKHSTLISEHSTLASTVAQRDSQIAILNAENALASKTNDGHLEALKLSLQHERNKEYRQTDAIQALISRVNKLTEFVTGKIGDHSSKLDSLQRRIDDTGEAQRGLKRSYDQLSGSYDQLSAAEHVLNARFDSIQKGN